MDHEALPTRRRGDDSQLPLVIGFLLALAVNFALWSGGSTALHWHSGGAPASKLPQTEEAHKKPANKLDLGQDQSTISSVAWISHDAFEKLIARKSRTRQPALQNKVKPVKHAPPRLNATPPAPNVRARLAPPKAAAKVHLPAAERSSPATPQGLAQAPDAGEAPFAAAHHQQRHAHQSQKPAHRQQQQHQQQEAAAAKSSSAKPTSAARTDSQSPPTDFLRTTHKVQPGKVVTGPGIKIKTAVPDFSAVALASSIPRAPHADITFDKTGRVINVKLTQSSDYPNVDSVVVESMYKWRATGKRMKAIGGPFTLHFVVLTGEED